MLDIKYIYASTVLYILPGAMHGYPAAVDKIPWEQKLVVFVNPYGVI